MDELPGEGYKSHFFWGSAAMWASPWGFRGDAEGVIQGVEFTARGRTWGHTPFRIGGSNGWRHRPAATWPSTWLHRPAAGLRGHHRLRRSREEMPAFSHEIEQATCEGVEIVFLGRLPLKTVTGHDGKVRGLICQKDGVRRAGRLRPAQPVPHRRRRVRAARWT